METRKTKKRWNNMVNVQQVKQSSVVGALMTIAIGLITLGYDNLQTHPDQWYIGIAMIVTGAILLVLDTYVLKTQENC
jgi:uncharacterized membrane protein HdeD (DUF308 family)